MKYSMTEDFYNSCYCYFDKLKPKISRRIQLTKNVPNKNKTTFFW